MNYEKPFYVRGIRVAVRNGGKSVVVYHIHKEVSEDQKIMINNVIQYLMDEHFVITKKCRVDIHCEEN